MAQADELWRSVGEALRTAVARADDALSAGSEAAAAARLRIDATAERLQTTDEVLRELTGRA